MATVLLFNPPAPGSKGFTREGRCTQESGIWGTQWPPVSLATCAAVLQADGHSLHVFDFPAIGAGDDLLGQALRRAQPDYVFWTTGTPTLANDLRKALLVRHCVPGAVLGVIGTHVSAQPEVALAELRIDMVIRREPEWTVREVCRRTINEWELIKGISYRDRKTGEVTHNPDADWIDPAAIPFPAWSFLDTKFYRLPLSGKPFLTIAPIRGCPYPCSFCTAAIYYGRRLRKRPVVMVVDEIEHNMEIQHIRDFFIWADTFTADREYVISFCREVIRRKLDIAWTCNGRADTVDGEMLALMKEAGLWMISFGLESGNERVLDACCKKIGVDESIRAVCAANRLGIKTAGHFILGLPEESEQTMRETLRLALELPLTIAQFYAAAPFPGTKLYEEARRRGWLIRSEPFSQGLAAIELPGLPARKVDAFRKYAYLRFYARPKTIMGLCGLMDSGTIGHVLRSMAGFFKWVKS